MNPKLFLYSSILFGLLFVMLFSGFTVGLIQQQSLKAQIQAQREQGNLLASSCEQVVQQNALQLESSPLSSFRAFIEDCREAQSRQP